MVAYYNEIDEYAAQWLRNLIAAGHIAAGDVDTRSIVDVRADDLKSYNQCHFFAGIGGWSYAFRLALWDDTRPVWSGSCPCQPYSTAGKQAAQRDERNLWSYWSRLIGECHPPVIFGEQVASAIAFGWLDEVASDLEAQGYSIAAAVLPACGVGAPHRRDRLWFVSHSNRHNDQQSGGSHRAGAKGRASLQTQGQGGQSTPLLDLGLPDIPCSASHSDGERCEGSICKPIPGQPDDALQSQRGFAHFNDGWDLSSPVVCGVDDGIPARAHKLRAYGNAIVPQVAAEFIQAYLETQP